MTTLWHWLYVHVFFRKRAARELDQETLAAFYRAGGRMKP
jgi:hypothetical protein